MLVYSPFPAPPSCNLLLGHGVEQRLNDLALNVGGLLHDLTIKSHPMIDILVRIWTMGSSGFIPGIVLKLPQSICRKSCWDNMRFGRTSNYLLQFQWHQMASLCETQTQPLAVPIHWNKKNNSITYPSNSQTFTILFENAKTSPWKLAHKNDDCDSFHLFSDCCHTIQSLMVQDAGKCRLLVIIHIHYLLPIGCTLIQTKPRCSTKRPSEKELICSENPYVWEDEMSFW